MTNNFDGLPCTLFRSWLSTKECEEWVNLINKNITWEQPFVRIYGCKNKVPRKTKFLAEKDISYRYSGLVHYGNGWPAWFQPLLDSASSACKVAFNGCLLNYYRDGCDRMGWHADNEPELEAGKPIASISLGAKRDFFFKNRLTNIKKVLPLHSGDLLIMHPTCQKEWLHSIPTRKKILESRINLTFRCYKSCYG